LEFLVIITIVIVFVRQKSLHLA